MNEEQIILVDEHDQQVGVMGKLATHEKGLLHRAFSIFIRNSKGEIMLQKRALGKYHSGGLWTNTCCGHPRDGEELFTAAHRRLQEEMGFDCPLTEITTLIYRAPLDKGLTEHEFLHVIVGTYDDAPQINTDEASEWKWITREALQADLRTHPDIYTYWFKVILKKVEDNNIALI